MSAALGGSSASSSSSSSAAAAAPASAAAAAAAASPARVEARPAKRKADADLHAAVSKHLRTMTRNALPPARMRGQPAAAAAATAAAAASSSTAAAGAGKIDVGQTKITSVQDDLQNAQRLLEVIKREATDRDAQIATLQADMHRMQKKHDAQAAEQRVALADLQRDLDSSQVARQEYREKVEQLQVEIEKQEKQQAELLLDHEEEQRKYEDDLCDYQADLVRAGKDMRELRGQKEKLQTSTQCIACMDAERSVFYLSCGHFLLCAVCDERLEEFKKPCPNCRKKINGRLKVFK